jgi:hypothetical protein
VCLVVDLKTLFDLAKRGWTGTRIIRPCPLHREVSRSPFIMMNPKTLFYVVAGILIVVAIVTRLVFAHEFLRFLRLTP